MLTEVAKIGGRAGLWGKIKISDLDMAEILVWTSDLEVVGYMSLEFREEIQGGDENLGIIRI